MQQFQGDNACLLALENSNARRALGTDPKRELQVAAMCNDVRDNGDAALEKYAREFDAPDFRAAQLRVLPSELNDAWREIPDNARRALERAASNIEAFHRAQPMGDWHATSPDGAFYGQKLSPISRVGLYAPNGRAAYPSTVLMLAVPARVARVREIYLATPANREGHAHPIILAAAQIAGVSHIFKMGGAAAMAAFAYGTQTVPRVDKVVGPGSIWVTLAKKHLYGIVGVDGLYGPSEVLVFADEGAATATQLAADLIAQAEHGADSWVCFVSPSRTLCEAVKAEVARQVEANPRGDYLRPALDSSLILCPDSRDSALHLCDVAAPEHLELWSRDALSLSAQISHAGAIFLNTPVPLGDYILGPSHTLPTGGAARFMGGVSVDTFLKRTTLVSASRETIASLSDDLRIIAELEGLPGHAEAVRLAAQQS